jgi:hypothetical protein
VFHAVVGGFPGTFLKWQIPKVLKLVGLSVPQVKSADQVRSELTVVGRSPGAGNIHLELIGSADGVNWAFRTLPVEVDAPVRIASKTPLRQTPGCWRVVSVRWRRMGPSDWGAFLSHPVTVRPQFKIPSSISTADFADALSSFVNGKAIAAFTTKEPIFKLHTKPSPNIKILWRPIYQQCRGSLTGWSLHGRRIIGDWSAKYPLTGCPAQIVLTSVRKPPPK